MIQYPRTRNNNIYFSNKRGTPPCFHPDTNPAIGHALVHSINKSHVLVVTVELIWFLFLNILSFNFLQTPRKSLRFTSYVNRPVVVLTDHCQSYTAFCLICAVQSGHVYFFLPLFVTSDSVFALLSTPVVLILLTSRWLADEQICNIYIYIKFNSWS